MPFYCVRANYEFSKLVEAPDPDTAIGVALQQDVRDWDQVAALPVEAELVEE